MFAVVNMSLTWTLLCSLFWAACSRIIYLVYFHPLAKYPGPFLAKLTPFWNVFVVASGNRHVIFAALHEKHGDFVRIAPNAVIIRHVSAQRDLHSFGSQVVKSDGYIAARLEPEMSSLVDEQDPVKHSQMRKHVSPAFSTRALEGMEQYIKSSIDRFTDNIKIYGKDGTIPLNMTAWCSMLTFDILSDLSYGETFGMVEKGEALPLLKIIEWAVKGIAVGMAIPPSLVKFAPYIMPKALLKGRDDLTNETLKKLKKRIGNPSGRKDLFTYMEKLANVEETDADRESRLNTIGHVFLVAGGDSISGFLTSTMYYILKTPRVYRKLYEEVSSAFSSKEDITASQASHLKYVSAVIEEGLRICLPIPGDLARKTLNPTMIAGRMFPAGIDLSASNWAMSRDERYFTAPNEFIPERWIDPLFERDQTLGKTAVLPFSQGPRMCIGVNLAYMEMRMTLAQWVLELDCQLVEPDVPYITQDYFAAAKPILMIKSKPRVRMP
ncbi:Isotrichodermin C-15 hydroxylase [Neolecta irregularis DAH-3]|uniref:Isotrichodermin C-15 hydroxylase n=1 Tax=Neolecta irregularis (strain DAH-3) TaxID=1198029 RepID=A0A1U7LJ05_NEOID|nr:Isotrichodermin C-15 hydroxylase [Neolecta irregularis DAH-3]|eukprot:OLL22532.1 Isotrichodermin C-15 hydroxylase [Neolecta irregularis DAH-3]